MRISQVITVLYLSCLPQFTLAQATVPHVIPNDVPVLRDLNYARYGDRILKLDLYLPHALRDFVTPIVVVIRGGGWNTGDKEESGYIAGALASRGVAAATIEFRLAREVPFPGAVEDTKAAVRWLRAHASTYRLDSTAIGALGGSSGAYLAIYLAVTGGDQGLEGDGGSAGHSSRVQAAVGMATPSDLRTIHDPGPATFLGVKLDRAPERWAYASPITRVGRDSPPILLFHSTADGAVDFHQSTRLAEKFAELGVSAEVVLIPNAPHAFWNYQPWFADTMDRVASFFLKQLAPLKR